MHGIIGLVQTRITGIKTTLKSLKSDSFRLGTIHQVIRLNRHGCVGVRVMESPRANWKCYIKFGEVFCPVALYTDASSSERIAFNALNRSSTKTN